MSNTRPIPRDKNEIALSTAVAGELLGMRLAYLEAGSGAETPVPPDMINFVKNNLSIPLIVGGGIKTEEDLKTAYDAGADLVVIGNVFESEPEKSKNSFNLQQITTKKRNRISVTCFSRNMVPQYVQKTPAKQLL